MVVSSKTSLTQNTNVHIWRKEINESTTKANMEILYQNTTSENSTLLVGQIVQVKVTTVFQYNPRSN